MGARESSFQCDERTLKNTRCQYVCTMGWSTTNKYFSILREGYGEVVPYHRVNNLLLYLIFGNVECQFVWRCVDAAAIRGIEYCRDAPCWSCPGANLFLQLAHRGDSFLLTALTCSSAFIALESWELAAECWEHVYFLGVCFLLHEAINNFRRMDRSDDGR